MEHFIDELVQLARQEAAACEFRLHVEYSHPTEAVYLRIRRQDHWFGLRIATHRPAYDCSSDFQQLLLPPGEDITGFGNTVFAGTARQTVTAFVPSGGSVVADPFEVQQAIQTLFITRQPGTRRRWPSTAEVCAVRHRLNLRAAWGYELETGRSAHCPDVADRSD